MTEPKQSMRFLGLTGCLIFLATSMAMACPDSNLEAEKVLSLRGLDKIEIIPSVPGKQVSFSQCEDFASESIGYINSEPSLALEVSQQLSSGFDLGGRSACDTNLTVQKPDGSFIYDDDSGSSRQPLLFIDGAPGIYNVWLGQYDPTLECSAFISLTPIQSQCPDLPSGIIESLNLLPGQSDQLSGLTTQAGGGLDLRGCDNLSGLEDDEIIGFVNPHPNFSFQIADVDAGDNEAGLSLQVPGMCDTALLVRDQEGTWYFDDDSLGELAPQLTLPLKGLISFDVWISVYNSDLCEVELLVEETSDQDLLGSGLCPAQGRPAVWRIILDGENVERPLDTAYGSDIDIGVCEDSYDLVVPSGSFSYTPQVNFVVEEGGAEFLNIQAQGSCDGVLLVSTPDKGWLFNDDYDGFNPGLSINALQTGTYSVWVGALGSDEDCTGQILYNTAPPACPSADLAAKETYTYTATDLGESKVHSIIAGGDTNAKSCNPLEGLTYQGYFMDRPDFAFDLDINDLSQVEIFTALNCDTVLLVQDASGDWIYNDDSDTGNGDSLISIVGTSGRYRVWVGTYGSNLCESSLTLRRTLSKD